MIKKSTCIFFLMLITLACSNNKNDLKKIVETVDSIKITQDRKEDFSIKEMQIVQIGMGKVLIVKDSSKYSQKFLDELRDLSPEYDTLILKDDNIILLSRLFNGKDNISRLDTIKIPQNLPLNIHVIYQAERENKKYSLILKRVNYTNVEYELEINDLAIRMGQVILSGGFILGAETYEDENGFTYGVTAYFDNSDCLASLTIEIDSAKRASFNLMCMDETSTESFDIPLLNKK